MNAQLLIGGLVFGLVLTTSFLFAKNTRGSVAKLTAKYFFGSYALVLVACAAVWAFAWIGIFLRQGAIWIAEAMLQPAIVLYHFFL